METVQAHFICSTGLYLHECGLLGASPDGESDDFVLEVKCPVTGFNHSDASSVEERHRAVYCIRL